MKNLGGQLEEYLLDDKFVSVFFFFVLVLFVLNDGSVINKNLSLLFQGSDREEAVKKTTGDI